MSKNTPGRLLAAPLMLGGLLCSLCPLVVHAARDESRGVSADDLGNVYISGVTDGSLDGQNAGDVDAFVSKLDALGNLMWTRQIGTAQRDGNYGVSADGLGNVYTSGTTYGSLAGPSAGNWDAMICKYDAAGDLQWTRQFGTSGDDVSRGVSADRLGNVYISGSTTGSLGGPNAGSADAFLSKYDAAGNFQWTRQFGAAGWSVFDISYGVSADGLGNAYVSGANDANGVRSNAYVAKYDAGGKLLWSRQLGTSSKDVAYGVSADGKGNVYISGETGGNLAGQNAGLIDAFLAKYDAAGNLLWTRQLGSAGEDWSYGVSADGLGSVYISGPGLDGLGAASLNAFLSKYDERGDFQWTRHLETFGWDWSYGVSADGKGHVCISGKNEDYSEHDNAYVALYDEVGDHQWTRILRQNIPEPTGPLLAAFACAAGLRWSSRQRSLPCRSAGDEVLRSQSLGDASRRTAEVASLKAH